MNHQMSDNQMKIKPLPNYGPILRGLLNGVKQTAESFAKIHHLDSDYLEKVMKGEFPLTQEIINAVENHSPLNARFLFDLKDRENFPVKDDTNDGVIIFSEEQMAKTIRTFKRGPKDGDKVPFYDYADTAMSKTSAFRPEWIKELYVHDGVNPNAPSWAFNHGHFEYQMTYFIGPVNFHWIDRQGKKHVRQMDTGDMNYITPFVPHTFTTRKEGTGLILAVTYGGAVATEQFQSEIKKYELGPYMEKFKGMLPTVNMPLITDHLQGVIIRKYHDAKPTETGSYTIRELMGSIPFQPHTKAFEYKIKAAGNLEEIIVDADRWGYNVGSSDIELAWNGKKTVLAQGSSFFIQPNTSHSFRSMGSEDGKLIVMEIKPNSGNPLSDLALIYKYSGDDGLQRVHSETKQWF